MINKFIKCATLALALNTSLTIRAIELEPSRISMCEKITALLALTFGFGHVGIYKYNATTPCPTLPEGFQPPAGTTVQIATPPLIKPHVPNFIYPPYNPETMEVPTYGRDTWENCILETTYKEKKKHFLKIFPF